MNVEFGFINEGFKALRYYQEDAVSAIINYLKTVAKGNGVVVMPTGSGKSYTISETIKILAGTFNARIIVASHTKKIVDQDWKACKKLWAEGKKLFGVNSAGLGMRSTGKQVIFGGIQSMYKSAKQIGKVNILIIDESHRCSLENTIQYKRFIKELLEINQDMRVIGFTATEGRPDMGLIYGPSKKHLFQDLIYKANAKRLINEGFLAKPICPPVSKETIIDTTGLPVSQKKVPDFLEKPLFDRANIKTLIDRQTAYVLEKSKPEWSIAVFAVNIEHAENIANSYRKFGENSLAVVHSEIDGNDDELVASFENGEIRVLISVNMFVEGFDAPNIMALDVRKPTKVPARYVQMLGRGFRLCASINKTEYIVFDFAGNVGEHGPVDEVSFMTTDERGKSIKANKQCIICDNFYSPKLKKCPYCGHKPESIKRLFEDKTNDKPSDLPIISEPRWFNVSSIHCARSKKEPSIIAHYYCSDSKKFTKEIFFDDYGLKWLSNHLGPLIPFDVDNFFNGGYRSKIKQPKRIFVDEAGESSLILDYDFS